MHSHDVSSGGGDGGGGGGGGGLLGAQRCAQSFPSLGREARGRLPATYLLMNTTILFYKGADATARLSSASRMADSS